jgi:hypothetical protein
MLYLPNMSMKLDYWPKSEKTQVGLLTMPIQDV